MKYCPECGTARTGKRCTNCGKSFGNAGKIVLIVTACVLFIAFLAFRLVLSESKKQAAFESYVNTRDEMAAYDKAAEDVSHKMYGTPVAPFSRSYVTAEGDRAYRVEVPFQGLGVNGQPATQIAIVAIHCDHGLCYVDNSSLK